jgi:HJR/Mrr/RecB family endonuclease
VAALVSAALVLAHPAIGGPVLAVVLLGAVMRLLHERRLSSTLERLSSVSPEEFERAVARVLAGAGWADVSVTGQAGDNGCDVRATDTRGRTVVVQCKRRAPGSDVGSQVVQLVIGAVVIHDADRAMVVTTAGYTAAARRLAAEHGVELVDGTALVRMAQRSRALTT